MIPEYLNNLLIKQYDKDVIKQIVDGYNCDRVVSFRINTIKTNKDSVIKVLIDNDIIYEELDWYDDALVVYATESVLMNLDIYKNGEIYLQSLSSQLPPIFLDPQDNELILDMAAAPGGKTTQIAALSNNKAMITAVEKNKIRSERLQYNVTKQGAKKVSVLNVDARNLNEYFMFDKILLDAPCSGTGTYTNNNFDDFSEDLVNRSVGFQKKMITEAIKHLKVGGELIYSTCSILKEENDDIVNYILNDKNLELAELDLSNFSSIPKLPSLNGTLCVCPTKYYEGFYVAKIKKIN